VVTLASSAGLIWLIRVRILAWAYTWRPLIMLGVALAFLALLWGLWPKILAPIRARSLRQREDVLCQQRLAQEEDDSFKRRLPQSRPAPPTPGMQLSGSVVSSSVSDRVLSSPPPVAAPIAGPQSPPRPIVASPGSSPAPSRRSPLERILSPQGQVSVTKEDETPYIFLRVTNHGPTAKFWARLRIEGPVSGEPLTELFARWDHVEHAKASIPQGESRRIRAARFQPADRQPAEWLLGRIHPGNGRWYVPYFSAGRAGEAAAPFETIAMPLIPIVLTVTISADPALVCGSIVVPSVTLPGL
jgi:hypothetical protein